MDIIYEEIDEIVDEHLESLYYENDDKYVIAVTSKKCNIICSLPGYLLTKYDIKTIKEYTREVIKSFGGNIQNIWFDIVKVDTSISNKNICIKKTYWLRLLQRRWKSVFTKYKKELLNYSSIKSITQREIGIRDRGVYNLKRNKIKGLMCDLTIANNIFY